MTKRSAGDAELMGALKSVDFGQSTTDMFNINTGANQLVAIPSLAGNINVGEANFQRIGTVIKVKKINMNLVFIIPRLVSNGAATAAFLAPATTYANNEVVHVWVIIEHQRNQAPIDTIPNDVYNPPTNFVVLPHRLVNTMYRYRVLAHKRCEFPASDFAFQLSYNATGNPMTAVTTTVLKQCSIDIDLDETLQWAFDGSAGAAGLVGCNIFAMILCERRDNSTPIASNPWKCQWTGTWRIRFYDVVPAGEGHDEPEDQDNEEAEAWPDLNSVFGSTFII